MHYGAETGGDSKAVYRGGSATPVVGKIPAAGKDSSRRDDRGKRQPFGVRLSLAHLFLFFRVRNRERAVQQTSINVIVRYDTRRVGPSRIAVFVGEDTTIDVLFETMPISPAKSRHSRVSCCKMFVAVRCCASDLARLTSFPCLCCDCRDPQLEEQLASAKADRDSEAAAVASLKERLADEEEQRSNSKSSVMRLEAQVGHWTRFKYHRKRSKVTEHDQRCPRVQIMGVETAACTPLL